MEIRCTNHTPNCHRFIHFSGMKFSSWFCIFITIMYNYPHGSMCKLYVVFFINMAIRQMSTGIVGRHDDVIKWKQFPRYWPFVREIHRSPVNSSQKGQWHGALMHSLSCAWINVWVNNREAGDLRCHRAHYDAIVISSYFLVISACAKPLFFLYFIQWFVVLDFRCSFNKMICLLYGHTNFIVNIPTTVYCVGSYRSFNKLDMK